jgi:predicted short-subunit dehydrogenase-like oxidoreductase (DUF2520 family)
MLGRLPPGAEKSYLHLAAPDAPVAGLLEHTNKRTQSPVGREDWQSVKAQLASMQHIEAAKKAAEREQREQERLEFEARKEAQLTLLANHAPKRAEA